MTIATVDGSALIGANNPDPFTVFTNDATNILLGASLNNRSHLVANGGGLGPGVLLFDNSRLDLNDGSIFLFTSLSDNSAVNYRGGNIGFFVTVEDNATLTIFGSHLAANLELDDFNGFSLYSLSGFLADGGDLSNRAVFVENDSKATLNLAEVPEPCAAAFAMLSALSLGGLIAGRRLPRRYP